MAPFGSLFTWSQAQAELQYRLGNRTDLGSGTQNRISQWLNSAQIRIASTPLAMEDLDQTLTLTTIEDQSEYSEQSIIPPMNEVIGIRGMRNDTTGVKMRRFPWDEYRSLNQQAPGPPLRWARYGYTLALDPMPNGDGPYEVLIDYRMNPLKEEVQIPNRYQEDWITVAEWIAWKALMKPDRAKAALSMLPAYLGMMDSQPLDRNAFESMWDQDQVIAPIGFQWPFASGGP